jgi:2-methylcitrate dehydratase PrpD
VTATRPRPSASDTARSHPSRPAAVVLADFCAALTWDRVPQPARDRTADLVLDLIGVASRGSAAPSSSAVRAVVAAQPPGAATVIGGTRSGAGSGALHSTASWAALANGTSAHATEMDDVTTESSLHPGVTVIPAALALAQERGASGRAFLEAVVCGYEVNVRVGNALGAASAYTRGFHPTGVAGVFGAAAAAGKLLRLDHERLAHALGIAGTMAAGSLEYLSGGAWTKRLNAGWAGHAGIVAADLAAAGFTGPLTALEGAHGLLRGYTDAPVPERLTDGLSLDDLHVMHVSIKPYGCCRYCHGIIDAVLALRHEHGLHAEDVASMRLGVLSGGWSLIADPPARVRDPRNVVDAQFSAPYAAAVAVARGRAGLAEFGDETLRDPVVRALTASAECVRDPSLDAAYPKQWPATAELTLRDGRVVAKRIEHALGEPENPVPRDALVARFCEMVGDRLSDTAAKALAGRIFELASATELGFVETLR